jgi:hypothetical protein
MNMLLTLMACSLLGGLLGCLTTRLPRKAGEALSLVLAVAYLTAVVRVDLQSPAWRMVGRRHEHDEPVQQARGTLPSRRLRTHEAADVVAPGPAGVDRGRSPTPGSPAKGDSDLALQ